ncbi:hypothetical protein LBMAG46_36950 [Planctomycetia bacterium]|nr:hypothetical protein LBMAG46_36950 [Planctomycetia bacterium]
MSADTVSDEQSMLGNYPYPAIRVSRIVRETNRKIGDFQLTAETAAQLVMDEIGLLIGNCGPTKQMLQQLLKLAAAPYPARWVVAVHSKALLRQWYSQVHDVPTTSIVADSEGETAWLYGNCWFTRLEQLLPLAQSSQFTAPVAGLIVVDPQLRSPYARGIGSQSWKGHDRPELVNSFRQKLRASGQQVPLILMTERPAMSLNTLPAQRAFALESLWFADGGRLRVGPPYQGA